MLVPCPKCGKNSSVPSNRLSDPGYQIKCLSCQTVFKPSAAAPTSSSVGQTKPAAPISQPSPPPPAPISTRPSSKPIDVHRCSNHPQFASVCVCPACNKAFCPECVRMVQTAYICLVCGGLCIRPDQYEKKETKIRQRVRSLREELPTILTYPFVDKVAFIILTLVVWIFTALGSFALMYGGGAILFSQGLLAAYTFSALYRVSDGNMKSYIPDISEIYDLVRPLLLGLAVFLISSAPLIVSYFTSSEVQFYSSELMGKAIDPLGEDLEDSLEEESPSQDELPAQSPGAEPSEEYSDTEEEESFAGEDVEEEMAADVEEDSEEGSQSEEGEAVYDEAEDEDFDYSIPFYAKFLLFAGILWKLAYAPGAFIVAGVSRSFLQTLNPLVGLDSIKRIGAIYWEAVLIYVALTVPQFIAAIPLGAIPIAGSMIKAFIDCYVALVIGCTLGLVIHKKAPELGLE